MSYSPFHRFVSRAHFSMSRHSHAGCPLTVHRGLGRSLRYRHCWAVRASTPNRSAISTSPTGSATSVVYGTTKSLATCRGQHYNGSSPERKAEAQ